MNRTAKTCPCGYNEYLLQALSALCRTLERIKILKIERGNAAGRMLNELKNRKNLALIAVTTKLTTKTTKSADTKLSPTEKELSQTSCNLQGPTDEPET